MGVEVCVVTWGSLTPPPLPQTPEELEDDSDFEQEDYDARSRTSVQTEDDQLIAGQSARVSPPSLHPSVPPSLRPSVQPFMLSPRAPPAQSGVQPQGKVPKYLSTEVLSIGLPKQSMRERERERFPSPSLFS